tara:strand:- start:92466 stop:93638 length:1173 start_codon:yes stop_codon:yes gene_type:complete
MSFLRWAVVALVVLVALVAASLTAEPGVWRDAVQWARTYRETSAQRAATCPVLVGQPLPGNPREAYERVGLTVLALNAAERQQLRTFAEGRAESDEQALDLVAKLPADALRLLRQSARMDGTMFSAGNLGRRDAAGAFLDQHLMLDAILVLSRHAASESERVHAWLDALACGWDLAGSELPVYSLVGLTVVGRAMDVADDQWLQELSPKTLREVCDALAAVDAATPVRVDLDSLIADMVLLVDEAEELQPSDIGLRSIYQAWQNGFSIEGEAIERVSRAIEQVKAFRDATPPAEEWASRRERLQRLVKDDELCNSDMMWGYLSFVLESEQSRRECVASVRVLRMALAERSGERLALRDPLGAGAIQVERQGETVRIFCAAGKPERRVVVK